MEHESLKCSRCGKFVTPSTCSVKRLWYGDERPEIVCRKCDKPVQSNKTQEATR